MSMRTGIIFWAAFSLAPLTVAAADDYSVEIRDAPLADAIRMLAHMQGKNVILSEGLTGTATVSFQSIKLGDAFSALLEANDLGAMQTKDVIYVSTKKALENLGKDLTTVTYNLRYAKAKDVEVQAKALISPRGAVMVDERTNAITVRDGPLQLESIGALVAAVDKLDKQVLIQAKVVVASKNFMRDVGMQWGISSNVGPVTINGLGGAPAPNSPSNWNLNTPAGSPTSGLALGFGPFGNTRFDIQLSLAEKNGKAAILSRPSIVTMNNKPAVIRSGVKFFVKTAGDLTISASSTGSSTGSRNLQQIDSGITLMVTPQITADNKISLAINVTQSTPDPGLTVDGIPSIVDNNATTTVLLQDGETTGIGGLFQTIKSKEEKGIPVIHRIPIFGGLFGSTSKQDEEKELLIFITPKIVEEGTQPEIKQYMKKKKQETLDGL